MTPVTESGVLSVREVSKHFGGVTALDGISLEVRAGEIFGLIGPNGAGKTTLFNVMTGLYVPERGTVHLGGIELTGAKPNGVAHAGLARTFQNIRLFANMTALENVMVGRHVRTTCGVLGAVLRGSRARAEEQEIRARAAELIRYVGLAGRELRLAHHLPYGDQRRLEIARALATDPKVLALDEPAAGMNPVETSDLALLLRRIRDDGVTLLLIEHDMGLVMRLCDRIAVLDYGEKIAEGSPEAIRSDERVIEAYLGSDSSDSSGALP